MSVDKHRQPGDSDKHLQDWRVRRLLADEVGTGTNPITEHHADEIITQFLSTPGNDNEYELGVDIPASGGGGDSHPTGFIDVSQETGGDLGAKINNALSALPVSPNDTGTLVIPPKSDGTNWSLSTSVTHDTSSAGVEIWVLGETKVDIDASHTGWVFDFTGGVETWNDPVDRVKFHGGYWEFADSWDGDGFLRLDDIYGSHIYDLAAIDCRNTTDDAVGIQIRNVDHFSEGNYLEHIQFREVDIGVDHVPASVTGGTGTESFHNERMNHVHIDGLEQVGVRFQGGCQLAASSFTDVAVWPSVDNVTAWDLDCEPDGVAIERPKVESPSATGLVAYRVRNSAFKRVHIYDPMHTGVDTMVDDPGDGQGVLFHNLENAGANIVHDGFRAAGIAPNVDGKSFDIRDVDADTSRTVTPVGDGDATVRDIYVIANGASDPAGAGNDDLIFEESA